MYPVACFPCNGMLKYVFFQVEQDWEEPAPCLRPRDPRLRLAADERPAQGPLGQHRPTVAQRQRHRGQP